VKNRTYSLKGCDIDKEWLVIDATDIPLGRLAVQVSGLLRGKHKPTYTPNLDMGDCVVVINAAAVKLTGQKLDRKDHLRWTGFMGGQRRTSLKTLMATSPDKVVHEAVWGMLPKNKLSRRLLTHLRVYAGAEHPHAAQQPRSLGLI
jgi:large subunit ribosomal protein L13